MDVQDNLDQLQPWLDSFLRNLEPRQRTRTFRQLAQTLRRSQAARIRRQKNPDGTPFEPRSPSSDNKGRKARMFTGLARTKHLRTTASADGFGVGYVGRAARIAEVHQFGLVDHIRPGGPAVKYAQRQLLGATRQDEDLILDTLLESTGGS